MGVEEERGFRAVVNRALNITLHSDRYLGKLEVTEKDHLPKHRNQKGRADPEACS